MKRRRYENTKIKTRCPQCGATVDITESTQTTLKQIMAFVCVFIRGMDHKQAGLVLGISRSEVTRLLSRLEDTHPRLRQYKAVPGREGALERYWPSLWQLCYGDQSHGGKRRRRR